MNYKVLNKGYADIREKDLLTKLLHNRGITDVEHFLNVSEKDVHDGMLLENMDRGLNMLKYHIDNNSRIHILYDVDNDGITSGTYTYNYLNRLNKDLHITYSMNKGKAHGIKVDNIPKDIQLLIIPDAGSDDKEEQGILCDKYEMDILVLDHHNFEKHENPYCIIINNQDGKYPNKHLSGVGVCYKFFKEFDRKYGYNYADIDLDLVAIGMIGDNMDMSDYETRYLALKGLSQINNETVKEILVKKKVFKDLDDKESTVNITNVEWDISPCFNATIRSGTDEERNDMLRAMNGEQELIEYKPRKSKTNPNPEIEQQTLQKTMARVFQNIRSRQNRSAEKSMKELLKTIEEQQLDKNKIIVVDSSSVIEESTFTGLVANKLAEHFKRPALVLREKDKDTYGGSGRNYKLCSIENLNKDLMDTNCFVSVDGHDNSFGIKIKKDKIQEMIKIFNEQHNDMIIEDVYLVDYEIPIGRLKPTDILQVGKWKDIWGGGIAEPLFAITNINLETKDIKLVGEKKNFIIINKDVGSNTIKFVKGFSSEEEYKKMIFKNNKGLGKAVERVRMDIIGKFTINEFNGNEYPQIEIIDYNVSQGTRSRF
jgi:single-stranded-DNA-specific exonuclease